MAETAVQKKDTNTLPATLMADFSEHAGAGMDAIGTEDMQIPFLRILQPLSPQLNKNDASYIKGASSGDLFNTVTGQFWSGEDGVYVILVGTPLSISSSSCVQQVVDTKVSWIQTIQT